VLGAHDEESRIVEATTLQGANHVTQSLVSLLQAIGKNSAGSAGTVS